jgi:hypothetical protein
MVTDIGDIEVNYPSASALECMGMRTAAEIA